MKKVFLVLSILVLLLAVSCATTKGADIPDRIRIVTPEGTALHPTLSTSDIWEAIRLFASEMDAEDAKVDDKTMTIVLENLELASNVGALAQDGEVIVRMTMKSEEGKATCVVSFVDAYTIYQLGPVTKKVATGLTELGLQEYEWQVDAMLDTFEYGIDQCLYYYGVQQGWYGEDVQKAYFESTKD